MQAKISTSETVDTVNDHSLPHFFANRLSKTEVNSQVTTCSPKTVTRIKIQLNVNQKNSQPKIYIVSNISKLEKIRTLASLQKKKLNNCSC